MKIFHIFFIVTLFNIKVIAQTYNWTGDGDGVSLYQEKNWSLNGENPAQINPETALTYNLLVNTGSVGGGGFNGTLLLGGNTLTVNGGVVNGNSGIASYSNNTDTSMLNGTGGVINCVSFNNLIVTLENSINITLSDNTSPLKGSTINLKSNYIGKITLSNISIADFRTNELSRFNVNGEKAIENDNLFLYGTGHGTTISLTDIYSDTGNKDYNDTPIPNEGPNIIYILLDDLGYGDLGNFWQNKITGDKKMATPFIDKMTDEGAMLTNHYASAPVCAPSRASLLEGLNQGHSSVRNNQFDRAAKNGLTLAEMLSQSGYRTMHVGKNGLAGGRNSNLDAHPLKRGFDQFYGLLFHGQGHIHYPQNGTTSKKSYFTDGYVDILEGTDLTYTTDVFTAKSKQWIEIHEETRPEQPFFLYLSYDVPHFALDTPTQAYPTGKGVNGGLQWTSLESETPWVNTASGSRNAFIHPDYESKDWTINEKKHATMIRRVDNAIEDIIQLLKDLNIDNETLIVFSSDNGPHNEGGQDPISFESFANLNGIKRDMWEGGIKMPTICRFPGTIPAKSTVTFPSGHWDWYATFAELANVSIPIYTDGVSLMPSLKQENQNQHDKGYLYHEYYNNGSTPNYSAFDISKRNRNRNQMQVIRMGDFKGIRYDISDHSDHFEIYNIANDPEEKNDLSESMTSLQQIMHDKVLQVRKKETDAIRPYDDELIPAVQTLGLINGLEKKIFIGKENWVPNFEYLTPLSNEHVNGINTDVNTVNSEFGLSFTGYIDIPSNGDYTFYLKSSSKCHIMIHDIHLIDNDFEFTTNEISEVLSLKEGLHPIRIYYQQNDVLSPGIDLQLSGPNIAKATVPNSMYFSYNTLSFSEDTFNDIAVSIFPQPIQEELNVLISNNNKYNKFHVTIYSMTGQTIYKSPKSILANTNSYTFKISTESLKPGLYILTIQSENFNKKIVEKFVKI